MFYANGEKYVASSVYTMIFFSHFFLPFSFCFSSATWFPLIFYSEKSTHDLRPPWGGGGGCPHACLFSIDKHVSRGLTLLAQLSIIVSLKSLTCSYVFLEVVRFE